MYKNQKYINVQKDLTGEVPGIKLSALTGHGQGVLGASGISDPIEVQKTWGYEMIYVNNALYCNKALIINPNCFTSMHFHIKKHETLLPVSGKLYIDYIVDKVIHTKEVAEYEAFIIAPGLPHSLRAGEQGVTLIESSTTSHDDDSIRLPEELCHERQ
ncbi:MAG: hypothetical protein CMF69_00435 [Magnetovibrio sp.]|nr:hypothetical protein [Magnetovibrio sp.]|tara:strand:+ start:1426 stop:1899 length:474 start_codon:yes stop_codon:yes gene_type:complete